MERCLGDWHRRLARVVGELSLALVRRRLRPGALETWAAALETTAQEMRRTT